MTAQFARGTQLLMGDGATPEVFTLIAGVTNISGPKFSLGTEDVTSHDDDWNAYIATSLDAGELSLELNFDPTDDTQGYVAGGLLYALAHREKHNYQLAFPDVASTKWTFGAFVTSFETASPKDSKLSASCSLKITGEPILE